MKTPTAKSLNMLRADDWTVQVTERWNVFAKKRQDLYGFCDILCVNPSRGFLAVQTTTRSNMNARIAKIKAEPRAGIFMAAGGKIQVHGWAKKGPRGKRKTWQCEVIEITKETV